VSLHLLALEWRLDGSTVAFLLDLIAVAAVYLLFAARGRRRDRRGRSWPWHRSAYFLAGLALLAVDLCSGIGTQADVRLSAHMVEHMVLWVGVAPLLAAGAPIRLAFFALPRGGRVVLSRWLRSGPVAALTRPVGSVSLFSAVILVTHLPAVYGVTLSNEFAHEAEHVLYLVSALLLWAPLLGVDPLPHRPGPRAQLACVAACMLPMVLIAVWLAGAREPVYTHYVRTLGSGALSDQRAAATIMWAGGLLAFAVPALAGVRVAARRPRRLRSQRAPA
jgi:putative membrane protein